MKTEKNLDSKLRKLPDNRAIQLKNITCPYCGIELTAEIGTKEHVIGRKFVPKGTLDRHWNLILRACYKCNSEKSNLEDDISAITLSGKDWFTNNNEEELSNETQRKAQKSVSRKTGKTVVSSQESLEIKIPLGVGIEVTFNLIAPPQIEAKRLYRLAQMHIAAFFYFVTYNNEMEKGGFIPDGFHPFIYSHYEDWGHSDQIAFMDAVVEWEPRWIGCTANGFFKSIIRRHPNAECWSWALEWNKNYRINGFFGDRDTAQNIVNALPKTEIINVHRDERSTIKYRKEISLADDDDKLFFWE